MATANVADEKGWALLWIKAKAVSKVLDRQYRGLKKAERIYTYSIYLGCIAFPLCLLYILATREFKDNFLVAWLMENLPSAWKVLFWISFPGAVFAAEDKGSKTEKRASIALGECKKYSDLALDICNCDKNQEQWDNMNLRFKKLHEEFKSSFFDSRDYNVAVYVTIAQCLGKPVYGFFEQIMTANAVIMCDIADNIDSVTMDIIKSKFGSS